MAAGDDSFARFEAWINERWAQNDWHNYIRGGQLNRTEMSKECLLQRGVFRSGKLGHARISELLEKTEADLCEKGILIAPVVVDAEQVTKSRESASSARDARLQKAEQENAILKARVEELERTLTKYNLMTAHMAATGRLIR